MAITGGLLIGAAAVILLSLAGRVAGVSGILWGALTEQATHLWRWLFLFGLIAGGALAHQLLGLPIPSPQSLPTSWAVIAGLLVGLGTKLGNGCTSGHGVCGIGFNSGRSAVATVTFMASGIATVFVLRHVLGAPL
ncbi:YeeE/YedE [gamma proteobacterium NOR5-3]|nr:YeeE/YedE [gamma proteobacterium NOR5-3]